jgi:hypothetical protein
MQHEPSSRRNLTVSSLTVYGTNANVVSTKQGYKTDESGVHGAKADP